MTPIREIRTINRRALFGAGALLAATLVAPRAYSFVWNNPLVKLGMGNDDTVRAFLDANPDARLRVNTEEFRLEWSNGTGCRHLSNAKAGDDELFFVTHSGPEYWRIRDYKLFRNVPDGGATYEDRHRWYAEMDAKHGTRGVIIRPAMVCDPSAKPRIVRENSDGWLIYADTGQLFNPENAKRGPRDRSLS
jgi:hypothetical protein